MDSSDNDIEQSQREPNLVAKFLFILHSIRRKVWRFMLLGFLCGFLLLLTYNIGLHLAVLAYGKESIESFPFVVRMGLDLSRDIGIGFFVGSIAGVGFEGLHQSTAEAQTEIERQAIEAAHQAKIDFVLKAAENMEHYQDPINAITHHLDHLLPNAKYGELKANIADTVRAIAIIKDQDSNQIPGKEATEYAALLAWMLQSYVLESAKDLGKLMPAIVQHGARHTAKFEPPDRKALAQRILAAQMASMQKGDHYYSIANINLYQGIDSSTYIQATSNALARGVEVRRVYNVCEVDEHSCVVAARDIQRQIDRLSSPRFMARVFRSCDAEQVSFDDARRLDLANRDVVRNLYFGVFQHQSGGTVKFRAGPSDVSRLTLDGFSNVKNVEDSLELFQYIWDNSSEDISGYLAACKEMGSLPSVNGVDPHPHA